MTVTSTTNGQTRTEQSNDSGLFVFSDLPIGEYAITITKAGFQTQKRPATELLTGQTIGLDIALGLGSASETVEVQADTLEVQTTTSEVATSVDQKQIQGPAHQQPQPAATHPAHARRRADDGRH